jgi:hypothetical protein
MSACLRNLLRRSRDITSARQEGWTGIENGELLRRAAGRLDVLVTIDKRIESAERLPANLALVTIRVVSNRIQTLRPLVPAIGTAITEIQPGASTRVDS